LLEQINDKFIPRKVKNNQPKIVPKSMQIEIVQFIHEIDHFDVALTEYLVRKWYKFKKIRWAIEEVMLRYSVCRPAKREQDNKEEKTIEKKEVPFDTYHVNFLGPLISAKKGYEYIFVVVDDFSKLVWLYSIRSKTCANVISCLKRKWPRWKHPFPANHGS
jgi:hypothetical protein